MAVGVLNFIPSVGSLSVAAIATVLAVITFPSSAYVLSDTGQNARFDDHNGNLRCSARHGRRSTLNPVMIFLGLSFWGWLWEFPASALGRPDARHVQDPL